MFSNDIFPSFKVFTSAVSIAATKIPSQPLDNTQTIARSVPIIPEQFQSLPIYYPSDDTANDDANVNLVAPDKPEEVIHNTVPIPATYLLPPSPDRQNEYFVDPTEPGEQTEWYPIAANSAKQALPFIHQEVPVDPNEVRANLRTGEVLHRGQVITVPSRNLLPPGENANNNFVVFSLSPNLELPSQGIEKTLNNQPVNIELPIFRPRLEKPHPLLRVKPKPNLIPHPLFRVKPESVPVPYIKPPENVPQEYKNPTRLYPKKYANEFKPIPIPVSQYEEVADEPNVELKSKDVIQNIEYVAPSKEKNYFLYEESQKKRQHQKGLEKSEVEAGDTDDGVNSTPSEQHASESNHRHHKNHIHPTHPRKERKESAKYKPEHKSKGERTEFRMHGMKGPHSYQFGFDTGKGKNRQFRYEERDNDGHVRGHYGYVDRSGKLRVVNYDAHPEHGFRAEAPVVKD